MWLLSLVLKLHHRCFLNCVLLCIGIFGAVIFTVHLYERYFCHYIVLILIGLVNVTSLGCDVTEKKAQREGGWHSQSVQLRPQGKSQDNLLSVRWVQYKCCTLDCVLTTTFNPFAWLRHSAHNHECSLAQDTPTML